MTPAAEPLVLLPGMMCDARLWEPQIAALSGTRTIIAAPLSGGGSIGDLAARVLVDAPPRFALAGLSMGGIVAMEVMRRAPDRVTRLALLDTNPNAELPEVARNREPQIAKVEAGDLRGVMRDEMKPNYLHDGPGRAAILDLCMAMAEGLGPAVFVAQSRALQVRPDQKDTLKGVRVPTLIACGEHDRLCPISRHEQMHGLVPGSQLVILPGAGHLPTLEQPDRMNEVLTAWLTR